MDKKKVKEAIAKEKETIKTLEDVVVSGKTGSLRRWAKDTIENSIIIIEALEKQLPKKPIDKSCVKDNDTIYGYVGIYPSCNGIVDDSMIVCDCTQVLDWSE